MLAETAMIVGRRRVENFHTIEIDYDTAAEVVSWEIRDKLQSLLTQGEVVVLTDFPVGTPFNLVCALRRQWEFIHMTGINIPLLLGLAMGNEKEKSVAGLCREVLDRAKLQLCNVEELARQAEDTEEKD